MADGNPAQATGEINNHHMTTNATTNSIPRSQGPLTQLGIRAIAGAEATGASIKLAHNTSVEIAADQYDLTGNPATPSVPGKQGVYNAKKEALKAAYAGAGLARANAREFCRQAIALLKSVLGTSYNSNWEAAGFLTRSLEVPDHPIPMLLQFRQFFERFPARENASLSLTALDAQAKITALQAAELGVATAKSERVAAKKLRDKAQKALRNRLIDLRGELEQLLEDDDGRWYEFGFHRPIDGRIPGPVSGIVLTPLAPGIVGVAWDRSARAENYRVKWFVDGGSSAVTEVGLFNERQCTLMGLPASSTIVVAISSRNAAGETVPTEERIVLP
jgi:hypothetical protein